MLYIISRPADAGFIDPRLTTKSVLAALDPLEGNVRLDFCRPPTANRMAEMLREADTAAEPYDLVHFDGHGTFDAEFGALIFEQPDDSSGESKKDFVSADRLGNLLAQHKIPLVILEACRSATLGKTAIFRSVAPRLIHSGIGSVLSMSHAVHIDAARLFLARFYDQLARGATIGHAVAQARGALVATPVRGMSDSPGGRSISLQDWFLPHLYQRGLDEPLLPRDAINNPPRQFDVFLSHNHNDSPRVEPLAWLCSTAFASGSINGNAAQARFSRNAKPASATTPLLIAIGSQAFGNRGSPGRSSNTARSIRRATAYCR